MKIWKTVKLGVPLEVNDKEPRLSECSLEVIQNPAYRIASEPTEVDLVRMSVKDCGFKDGVCYKRICARIQELGLKLCPAEVGPQLRLQYPDQPQHELILIAMEAIYHVNGSPEIFGIGAYGENSQLLNVYTGHPDHVWHPDYEFVFVLPKNLVA